MTAPPLAVGRKTRVQFPAEVRTFFFTTEHRPHLTPIQHPIRWVRVTFRSKPWSTPLTLNLALRWRNYGVLPQHPFYVGMAKCLDLGSKINLYVTHEVCNTIIVRYEMLHAAISLGTTGYQMSSLNHNNTMITYLCS